MLGGLLAGLVYILISLGIKKSGSEWIMKLLPPIVVGPVVMVIGLALAHTAVNMAMNGADGKYSFTHFSVALVTLAITIICSIFGKDFQYNTSVTWHYRRIYLRLLPRASRLKAGS